MWETKQICYVSILLPSSDINVWLTRAALTEHSWLISCSIHTFLFSFYSKNCEILLNLLLHKFWDLAVLFCSNSPQPCEHLSHFSGHLLEFTAVPFFFCPIFTKNTKWRPTPADWFSRISFFDFSTNVFWCHSVQLYFYSIRYNLDRQEKLNRKKPWAEPGSHGGGWRKRREADTISQSWWTAGEKQQYFGWIQL